MSSRLHLFLLLGASAFSALTTASFAQQAVALTSAGTLVSFNLSAPGTPINSVPVSGLAPGETVVGLDYRPLNRSLVAVTNQSRLVTLNADTGAATLLSTLNVALSGSSFGVDFNPVPDRLRVISNTGQNLRINVDNGAVTVDGALAFAPTDVNAAATPQVGSSRVDLQACKLEYSIVSPK